MLLSDFGLSSSLPVWAAGLLFALSFIIGVLGGMVGLALGTIRLPLMLLLGVPASTAASTSILLSCVTAVAGSYAHLRQGRVKPRMALVVGTPPILGAFIGGLVSGQVHERALIGLAGGVVLWQGIEFALMAIRRFQACNDGPNLFGGGPAASAGKFTLNRVGAVAGIGAVVGVLGGAIGLALGTVRLPLLIRVLRVEPRIAAGVNLFVGMLMGAVGWVGHLLQGQLDWTLVALLGPSAIVGSYLGARVSGRVDPKMLVLLMGVVLIVAGIMLLWRGLETIVFQPLAQ